MSPPFLLGQTPSTTRPEIPIQAQQPVHPSGNLPNLTLSQDTIRARLPSRPPPLTPGMIFPTVSCQNCLLNFVYLSIYRRFKNQLLGVVVIDTADGSGGVGSIPMPVESNTVSPTTRHLCDVSSGLCCVAQVLGCGDGARQSSHDLA